MLTCRGNPLFHTYAVSQISPKSGLALLCLKVTIYTSAGRSRRHEWSANLGVNPECRRMFRKLDRQVQQTRLCEDVGRGGHGESTNCLHTWDKHVHPGYQTVTDDMFIHYLSYLKQWLMTWKHLHTLSLIPQTVTDDMETSSYIISHTSNSDWWHGNIFIHYLSYLKQWLMT